MSLNNKNTYNYSALLNEIKATTLNEKIKGRNHKSYIKRVNTQNTEKSETFLTKTTANPVQNPDGLNQKYASIDLRSMDKKKNIPGSSVVMKDYNSNNFKTSEQPKRRNPSISSNLTQNSASMGNKIDIKISVNYNKPTITNTVNYANSNASSGLSSSKSFYNSHNHFANMNGLTQSHNQTTFINANEAELIKNKLSSSKAQNNFNSSCISDEKYKEKILEQKKQLVKNTLATSDLGFSHLRNKSQNMFDQNNLNVSLMGYENKNLKNFLINHSNIKMNMNTSLNNAAGNEQNNQIDNSKYSQLALTPSKHILSNSKFPGIDKSMNQSFAVNNKLFSHLNKNMTSTPKNGKEQQSLFYKNIETTIENNNTTGENISTNMNIINTDMNMKDFTLNRNNEETMANTQGDLDKKIPDSFSSKLVSLETNLDDQLGNLRDTCKNNDKGGSFNINYINKKYMIYKKTLEEYLNVLHQKENQNFMNNLVQRISEGFNEIFKEMIVNNQKLTEKSSDYDHMASSKIIIHYLLDYKVVSKKYSDLFKAYQEKSEELKFVKAKITQTNLTNSKLEIEKNKHSLVDLSLNLSNSNIKNIDKPKINNLNTSSGNKENLNFTESVNETNSEMNINKTRIIKMMNKNVLDDLDAIYFFDKINMRSNSASHKKIPKLDLNFLEINERMEREKAELEKAEKGKEKENSLNNFNKKAKDADTSDKSSNANNNILINPLEKIKNNKKTSVLLII